MNCQVCQRAFVSDKTPTAERGICMLCRPQVQVSCVYCGVECPGCHDGLEICQEHREMRHVDLKAAGLIRGGSV